MSNSEKISKFKNIPSTLSNTNRTLGIRGRLLIGFSSIVLIMLLTIIITLANVHHTQASAHEVLAHELPASEAVSEFTSLINGTTISLQSYIINKNDSYKNEFNKQWANIDQYREQLDDYTKTTTNEAWIKKWNSIRLLLPQLRAIEEKIINSKDPASYLKLLKDEVEPIQNQFLTLLLGIENEKGERPNGLDDELRDIISAGAQDIIDGISTLQTIDISLLIIGLIISIFVGLYTSHKILQNVTAYRNLSGKIAAGDLTERLLVTSKDELGQLGNDLNIMTDNLATITKKISEASHNTVITLEEVKKSVEVQSSGASEQAASIHQITSTLKEIEKSSNQTLEKANLLGQIAQRTQEKGQQGLQAVEQSIEGMKEVSEKVQIIAQTILELSNQSQRIGEITIVVSNLAQQSKILALNASIEAAKAGEAGKGFAVVAAEVKNLAEQSEQSTIQVQKILEDIAHATEKVVLSTEEGSKGVERGMSLIEQTGETVNSLRDVIHETTMASQQIEAAVRQESMGIEQITIAMGEINQVTSSFVASVKQTTEAIQNLADMAKSSKDVIDIYKI